MKIRKGALAAIGLAAVLTWSGAAQAHDTSFEGTSPEIEVIETEEDEERADDWFVNPNRREDYGEEGRRRTGGLYDEEEEDEDRPTSKKYKRIYADASYVYYMDRQNTKWVAMPYRNQKMLDVWVRLVPVAEAEDCEIVESQGMEYPFKGHYFLEHYYMKLHPEQIQFLCELEVTGRPNNDVHTGRYNPAGWEDLVPGSIEDRIFHRVMKHYKDTVQKAKDTKFTDFMEDVFRISL